MTLIETVPSDDSIWDQDIFGIRDPKSGLLDIVSIFGRNCKVFAVHVHRPPEGYVFWRASKEGTLAMDTIRQYVRQIRMVELEFLNKDGMEAEDYELYERLDYAAPPRGSQRCAGAALPPTLHAVVSDA